MKQVALATNGLSREIQIQFDGAASGKNCAVRNGLLLMLNPTTNSADKEILIPEDQFG
jgi:hypothetical protein